MSVFEDHSKDTRTSEEAVLLCSAEIPENSIKVKGVDFNKPQTLESLLEQYQYCGFQATNLGLAIKEINSMVIMQLILD